MIIDGELDICPSYGWQGGPEFNTLVKVFRNGRERRKPKWLQVRHRYLLPFLNITDTAYLTQLKSAYLSSMGMAHAFRVKDRSDYLAVNEVFGLGDSNETEFDLTVTASFGDASYTRIIRWPVDPVFTDDGVPVAAAFDYETGKVVFDSAPAGVLRWSGEFRVIVRFASDAFPMTIDNRMGDNYAMNGSVELMEVFE